MEKVIEKRARIAVTATFVTNGLVVGAFVARIPDIKESLRISNSILSLCLLAASLGVLAALTIAGKLCAKYGSSPIAIYGSFLMVSMYTLQGLSIFSIWSFALASFAAGYGLATQDVAMNSHAIALEHLSKRRFMSVFHAMFSVGGFSGGLIGGVFAQFNISYAIQTTLLCLGIAIIAFCIKDLWLPASIDKSMPAAKVKRKKPKLFMLLGFFGLCSTIGEGSAGDWGGVLTRENYQASPFISTLPFIVFSFTMIVGRFSGDLLATKFGASRVLASGGLIACLGLTTGLYMDSTTGTIFGWFWLGAGLSVAIPLLFSAVGSLANDRFAEQIAPSEAVAMVSGISYLGFILGPPLIGFLADSYNLHSAMFLPAVLALAIVASARFARSA